MTLLVQAVPTMAVAGLRIRRAQSKWEQTTQEEQLSGSELLDCWSCWRVISFTFILMDGWVSLPSQPRARAEVRLFLPVRSFIVLGDW